MLKKYRQQRKYKIYQQFLNKSTIYYLCHKCKRTILTKSQLDNCIHDDQNTCLFSDDCCLNQQQHKQYFCLPFLGQTLLQHITLISVGEGCWKIVCGLHKCGNQIGQLDAKGKIKLTKHGVNRKLITYYNYVQKSPQYPPLNSHPITHFPPTQTNKNTKLKKVTKLQQLIHIYISYGFKQIQQKLQKIDVNSLQKSQNKLQSFIKFYRKWTNTNRICSKTVVQDS